MIDVEKIRKDFPMLKNQSKKGYPIIYFDNAATTFKPQSVIDTVIEYYTKYSVNVERGDYELSYIADTKFDEARQRVADFINCKKNEVVFTSNASGSLNLVAYGYGQKYLKKGDVIISDEGEHASNYLPWVRCCEKTGAEIRFIPLDDNGFITVDNLEKVMDERVKIISIAQISNVLAAEADVKEFARVAHEHGAILVVDGAQSVPHIKVDMQDLDCDFFAFSGHKLCGPTGIGVLYGKSDLLEKVEPMNLGGESNARYDKKGNIILKNVPFRFESGTPPIEAALGMKAAIDYIDNIGMENIRAYEQELGAYMLEKMKKLDNVVIYNEKSDGGIVTFNIKDVFSQDAATFFSDNGISLRSGQHCAKLLVEELKVPGTLRASLYFYNTKEEIDRFIEVCARANKDTCLDVFF